MAVQTTDPTTNQSGYTPSVNFGAFGTAILDGIGANICDWITGASGGIINLKSWSAQLRQDATDAVNNSVTIANGVNSNITGATPSTNPADVGNSVAVLNNTVQSSSQPPQTTIVTATQNVSIPTGCRTVSMQIFGAGGGGARGQVGGGSGTQGGGGGVGGWNKDVSLPTYAMTSTLHVVIGTKGIGGTADSTPGTAGGTSYVASADGTTIYAQATGGGGGQPFTSVNPTDPTVFNGTAGSGNGVAQLPGKIGGHGGCYQSGGIAAAATAGAGGLNVPGGAAGAAGAGTGGNGTDDTSTLLPGNGGSGGGGGGANTTGNAGNAGHGGHPGGAGGGGGAFYTFGSNGNGGDGADGEIWLTFVF
ncbi:MAG: hypothetical protein J2P17_00785 [Mycobacterium sp.]|nr:hypothetical protein [Mycobacterium sp.]